MKTEKTRTTMNKPAEVTHPIHDLLHNRWSPRAFSTQPVKEEALLSLFEAARWSPSGGNVQPWAFIVTTRSEGCHDQFVQILAGHNKLWAKDAPLLVLTVATPYPKSDAAGEYSFYDLGQAVAHLTVQAGALGLVVHQMAGFDHQAARLLFALPEGYQPMTVIAIGYQGDAEDLPEMLRERELAPRTRKSLEDIVFVDRWGQPLK
jgi:nitroreductase